MGGVLGEGGSGAVILENAKYCVINTLNQRGEISSFFFWRLLGAGFFCSSTNSKTTNTQSRTLLAIDTDFGRGFGNFLEQKSFNTLVDDFREVVTGWVPPLYALVFLRALTHTPARNHAHKLVT